MAQSGWGATLVYAGALFIQSYGLSTAQTGVLLGLAALGYFPGTLLARRHAERHARGLLVVLGLVAAAGTALLGLVRPSPLVSFVLFAACMAAIGGRTIAGSAFGLDAAPDQRVAVMGLRAAAVQFGYLLGAAAGGVALAMGGYGLLGAILGVLFLLGVAPHLGSVARLGPPAKDAIPALASNVKNQELGKFSSAFRLARERVRHLFAGRWLSRDETTDRVPFGPVAEVRVGRHSTQIQVPRSSAASATIPRES
jgi:MFS family permease